MKDLTTALERELTRAIDADQLRGAPPATSRRGRRVVPAAGALTAATAAIAVALALLPGGGDAPGDPSGRDVLRAAAAVAADERGPDGFAGYRYVRVRHERSEPLLPAKGQRPGHARIVQVEERWADADWQGRVVRRAPRLLEVAGSRAAVDAKTRAPGPPAGTDRFRKGSESVYAVPLRELPPDPARLRAAWEASLRAQVARRGQEPQASTLRWDTISSAIALLGTANVPGELRAAAFGLLAELDGARALGEQRDRLGRRGQAVELGVVARQRARVTIDPRTSDLLEVAVTVRSGDRSSLLVTTYEAAARVGRLGARP